MTKGVIPIFYLFFLDMMNLCLAGRTESSDNKESDGIGMIFFCVMSKLINKTSLFLHTKLPTLTTPFSLNTDCVLHPW